MLCIVFASITCFSGCCRCCCRRSCCFSFSNWIALCVCECVGKIKVRFFPFFSYFFRIRLREFNCYQFRLYANFIVFLVFVVVVVAAKNSSSSLHNLHLINICVYMWSLPCARAISHNLFIFWYFSFFFVSFASIVSQAFV